MPPYSVAHAPLGPAALMGYLKANGCNDFDFLDLRLYSSYSYAPTYRASGVFGETYVLDIPDLPLVLHVLNSMDLKKPLEIKKDKLFDKYCMDRGINPDFLHRYIHSINDFITLHFAQLQHLKFIGFSVWTSNFLTTLMAARYLKMSQNPPFIVAGGPQVTESKNSAYLGLLSKLFDAVITGEGEQALLSLYNAFSSRGTNKSIVEEIPGVLLPSHIGKNHVISRTKLIDMSLKPLPDFSRMPIYSYMIKDGTNGKRLIRELPFELSRGCVNKCSFCSEWVLWQRYRHDTVDHAIDQIKRLQSLYNINHISFTDSSLNGNRRFLAAFARELINNKMELTWSGYMRADMDKDLVSLLKQSGLSETFVGIESLSDETLKAMNKKRSEEDNVTALTNLLDAGVRVTAGYIPGFPADNRERFLHTTLHLRDIQRKYPDKFKVNLEPFTVSPNQPVFKTLEKFGLNSSNWHEDVLDIAGRYREITSNISCYVEGENQGIDKIGEYQMAKIVATDLYEDSNEKDSYVYSEGEDIKENSFKFDELLFGWYLASIKTPYSTRYSLIVSAREKYYYNKLIDVDFKISDFFSFVNNNKMSSFLNKLNDDHLIKNNTANKCKLFNVDYFLKDDKYSYLLSPFVLARVVSLDNDKVILLVDKTNRNHYTLPLKLKNTLLDLADKSIPNPELNTAIGKICNDNSNIISEMTDNGFLWRQQGKM